MQLQRNSMSPAGNGNYTLHEQVNNNPRPYFRKRLKRKNLNKNDHDKIIHENDENKNNHNDKTKKIPIQQNSAENFCKTKCVRGNKPKKCYIDGKVGQCSSCRYGGELSGLKEQKIQKICFQLCNFIPSQDTCKSFAYVLKLKVDASLLQEFGLKRKY